MPKILSKTQDQEGLWVVRVQIAETESILLICAYDPVDEEAFFLELNEYLNSSPDQVKFSMPEKEYDSDDS